MHQKITEKNLLTIVVFIMGLFLVIVIAYNLAVLSKVSVLDIVDSQPQQPIKREKNRPDTGDYKRIIEESKLQYQTFMEKSKSRNQELP